MTAEEDLLGRVDDLLPSIAARASEADSLGAVPDEVIQSLIDADVFATIAPRVYGGLELGLDTFSALIQRISAVSPSTGWVTSFLTGAAWRLLVFSGKAQEEMYGGRNYVLGAGTAQPIFGVERIDGGYLLSGRTAWNSGASHAEWFTINGLLREGDGPPRLLTFALPRADVTILDTWQVLGMKATASCDVSVEQVFVPDYRTAPFVPALEGQSAGHELHPNPMYHLPFLPFAMTEVVPVIVGTHRGAAGALSDRTRTRLGTLSGNKATERVSAQIRMAHGLARAEMAEQMLAAMIARNMANMPASDRSSRAFVKLHASMVATFCLDSVNEMARGVGGDAFRDEAPFQRFFRDINIVARHAFLDPDTAGESYGKLQLGLPTDDQLI